MTEDKQTKIDIPESIDAYKVTLFWGLTIAQVVMVFAASILTGFAIMGISTQRYVTAVGMLLMAGASLLGIIEIRGRNFFRHVAFIVSYYKNKPRVLIYHHYAGSGLAAVQAKQLVFQKENDTKTLVIILIAVILGVILLGLTLYYLSHVIHH